MTTTNSILAASKPARKLCCPSACTTAACCSGVGQLSRGKLCAFLLMPASNPARTMATSCSVVDMPTTTTTTGTCVPYEKKEQQQHTFYTPSKLFALLWVIRAAVPWCAQAPQLLRQLAAPRAQDEAQNRPSRGRRAWWPESLPATCPWIRLRRGWVCSTCT
jgi:hypothetical protein